MKTWRNMPCLTETNGGIMMGYALKLGERSKNVQQWIDLDNTMEECYLPPCL